MMKQSELTYAFHMTVTVVRLLTPVVHTALSARKLRAEQLGIMPLMIWLLVALSQPEYQSLKSHQGYSDLTENDQTVFHSSRG